MKEINGMETARAIRCLSADTYIVFVTAFIFYVLEGYKVNALRYRMKEDANLERSMKECLDAVIADMNYKEVSNDYIACKESLSERVEDILYIAGMKDMVLFLNHLGL